ncbi:MAG: hypothetical protein ACLP4V_05690 [Methylocella sp.]
MQATIEGAVPQTDDRRGCPGEPCANPVGDRRGIGRDETHRCADCRGHDHSTINVLILVPVFFVMMKARALRQGKLQTPEEADA